MYSKVILNKKHCKLLVFFALILYINIDKPIFSSDEPSYFNSYYGSILAGQIAKYNNDNEIASKYYRFANQKNPKNKEIIELSLMSSILSGNVN